MKSKLAMALCIIGMVGILGVAIAGNLDSKQTPVGDQEGFLSAASGISEQEAAAVPPARVEKTGQTTSYRSRDDGSLEKGVAWPNPRFTDNGNGTVTDNLTGLIWLKNANCSVFYDGDTTGQNGRPWAQALRAANRLKDGYCGLTDGSNAGRWRLPNVKELQSLIHFGFYKPPIPDTAGAGQWTEGNPFSGVQSNQYWSSTTHAFGTGYAWVVYLSYGGLRHGVKSSTCSVWPVRGGQ